ncbi:methyl-accepting chemotaxis protein [Solibacillus sp. CAU 1738]|uniref:methyl-accepting chemotaxis protein n=1 Tax=Solibacillus sp. CAU 1738 TaxID=3140363 RepID=UPI003260985F
MTLNPKIQAAINAIDFYHTTYPEDACVVIADTERILAYKRGENIDLKITVGDELEKYRGSITEQALTLGKFLRDERGPEKFGFAYISTAQPIFDNGKVIGVITATISNAMMDNMRMLATELSSSVEEMTATNEELTKASIDVSNRLEGLSEFSEMMTNDIHQINVIVSLVKDIATKSKILGLNASIEAARSGEHGRGFAVVASEIQKMAQTSTESANNIAAQLEKIKASIDNVNISTNQIAAFTEQFSASMHELNDAYLGVNRTAENLLNISEIKS